MMDLIRRSHIHLDITSFCCLFNSVVRPHFEYCVSIWYLLLKEDEELIENVLRRAAKSIPGLYDKPYKEGLAAIKVSSMRYHRMRGDMILVYKILRGDNQPLRDLLMIIQSRTGGHNFKLYKPLVQTTIRKHFFGIRVINNSNSLPYKVVNAVSLNKFKSKLDNAWEDKKCVLIKKMQNEATILHAIGLAVCTNSSSCFSFFRLSLLYSKSVNKKSCSEETWK